MREKIIHVRTDKVTRISLKKNMNESTKAYFALLISDLKV